MCNSVFSRAAQGQVRLAKHVKDLISYERVCVIYGCIRYLPFSGRYSGNLNKKWSVFSISGTYAPPSRGKSPLRSNYTSSNSTVNVHVTKVSSDDIKVMTL